MLLLKSSFLSLFTCSILFLGCEDEEKHPELIKNLSEFTLQENSPEGTVVATLAPENEVAGISFSIIGGDPLGAFAINSTTGELLVNDSSQIDYETTSEFELEIEASNNGGRKASGIVIINIVDLNEIPAGQLFDLEENSAEGFIVGVIAVEDIEDGYTFSIESGNPGNPFAIAATTGELTVADSAAIDFEAVSEYQLTVKIEKGTTVSSGIVTIHLTDATPTTDHLVSYYDFSGAADDLIASNHGLFEGVQFPLKVNSNYACKFEGAGTILFPTFFDYSARTVSIWLKVETVGESLQIIYSADHADVQYGMTILSAIEEDGVNYLQYNVSNIINRVAVEENTWYHAAFVVDGFNFSLYLNGEKFHEQSFSEYVVSTSEQVYAGATLGCGRGATRYFNGLTDDLRIYDRALGDREIELVYYEEPQ